MRSPEQSPADESAGQAAILRPAKVVGATWLLAVLLLAGVVTLTGLLGDDAVDANAAVVNVLYLDVLAAVPSGTALRSPHGAYPATVTAHEPIFPNVQNVQNVPNAQNSPAIPPPATGTGR